MSPTTARTCKKRITAFLLALRYSKNQFMPTFVTLTLPAEQMHTDYEIKKVMFSDKFMKRMKRKFGIENYFWRCEPQANGNIHFHVIFDKFIPWQDIRGNWNAIIRKAGYIEKYRENQTKFHGGKFRFDFTRLRNEKRYKFWESQTKRGKTKLPFIKWEFESQKRAYDYGVETNWNNPNTTDIQEVHKKKNIAAYVCKYMTKSPQQLSRLRANLKAGKYGGNKLKKKLVKVIELAAENRKIEGRIHGCSDSLRGLELYSETHMISEFVDGEELHAVNYDVDDYLKGLKYDGEVEVIEIDSIVTVYLLKGKQTDYLSLYSKRMLNSYHNFYRQQSKKLYA